MNLKRAGILALALTLLAGASTKAAFVVAPNANTAAAGDDFQFIPLANYATTFQIAYAASQFSSVPTGSTITSLGFRLPSGVATFATALNFSSYTIEIGKAALGVANLSETFASNLGADTITARSGALTIPGGSLVGGSTVNPFYSISFTTPYVYTGGDLLITLIHTAESNLNALAVDANTISQTVGANTLTNTVAALNSSTSTSGRANFYNSPVIGLTFGTNAVPEPASCLLLGMGGLVVAGARYLRARAA